MGNLCGGGNTGSAPGMGETTVHVHGDIFLTDVRSALSILKICEIKYVHEGSDVMLKAKAGENVDPVMMLAEHSPILEEKPSGRKHCGSAHEILMELCLKDQRNAPKKDSTGKMVKSKIPSMYPTNMEKHIREILEWYMQKMKPHSLHFFKQVHSAIKFEKENGYNENPKASQQDKDTKKEIDQKSESITQVTMGHIHAAFEAFNNHLKSGSETALERVQYSCCGQFTVMDIIMFNEVFQILHLYEVFVNTSRTKYCADIKNNSPTGNYQGINELFNYSLVKKWFENIAKSAEGRTLTFFNSEFKTKFEENINKSEVLVNKSGRDPDFLAKLNRLREAGPPGAGMKH